MMTSPSGNLGNQFNMGRVPSMGLGNLDSMELPDTVRHPCTQTTASCILTQRLCRLFIRLCIAYVESLR